ncbi:MAG: NAD(P)/FAD-dependent oxidoreductase [Desulfuromusa sp.]|nr:NAD(P)/FAD-dependent oxidoreductase [Desulfuromusa sp.]
MLDNLSDSPTKPHILIVGGGFAGLQCVKQLAEADVDITLTDQHNYHLFQPLLYQVATAALSPADIAAPIRRILRNQQNVRVVMATLLGADLQAKLAHFKSGDVPYDYLILASGVTHSYFGRDDWAPLAPGLKSIDDALEIRRRVLLAYEAAEWEADAAARQADLTFIVVGGGPTGVELAGALKEIAAQTVPKDFRNIDTATAKVVLVEAADRLLGSFPEKLGIRALQDLQQMGVEVRLNSLVTHIQSGGITIGTEFLDAENIIWAAGVRGSEIAENLGVELDKQGRVVVSADLSIAGFPDTYVIGDLAHVTDKDSGQQVPGVAQAAIQMGEYVAKEIRRKLGEDTQNKPFTYSDRGSMATIGRNRAVATIAGRHFTGFFAWLIWGVVHIFPLVNFRRKLAVLFSWVWSYFSRSKNVRLITGEARIKVKKPFGVVSNDDDKPS